MYTSAKKHMYLPGLRGILTSITVPNFANTSFKWSSVHCNTWCVLAKVSVSVLWAVTFSNHETYCTLKLRFLIISLAFSSFFLEPFCWFSFGAVTASVGAKWHKCKVTMETQDSPNCPFWNMSSYEPFLFLSLSLILLLATVRDSFCPSYSLISFKARCASSSMEYVTKPNPRHFSVSGWKINRHHQYLLCT